MSSVLSSASNHVRPAFNAAAAFFKNVGHTATTPAGAFLAAASAVVGGASVFFFNRVSSSNMAAADVAAAASSDNPLPANVSSSEATSVSDLYNRVTTSVKNWANSFVSFLSGLVPSFLRSKTEEAVDADSAAAVVAEASNADSASVAEASNADSASVAEASNADSASVAEALNADSASDAEKDAQS